MSTIILRRLNQKSKTVEPVFDATLRRFGAQSANPAPSPAKYDDLINAAGRKGDFSAVRDLLKERLNAGILNTSNTFKFMATSTASIDELLRSLAALDDWFTRKHAHDALVSQLARLHRTAEALRVAENMARRNHGATALTFDPIVNALAKKKDFPAAWRAMDTMRAFGIRPSPATYNYILTGYCFVGDVASAADTVEKMEAEGVEADARTYDALVLGACRAGRMDVAVAVVRRAAENEVTALVSTYTHIIGEMVNCGYNEQALEFVRIFAGENEKFDAEIFSYLARRLTRRQRLAEAESVAEEMKQRGLPIGDLLQTLQVAEVKE